MINKLIIKYNRLSSPVKAAFWFTICNLLLKGISFVTVPIFTRMLSEVEYGKLSLYISYEQFFLIFATWEIQNGAYQKGLFKYRDNIKNYTTSTVILINIITTIFFCLIILFIEPISSFTEISKPIFMILWIFFLVQPSYNCWLIRQRTEYKYKSAVTVTIAYSLINVIMPIMALKIFEPTAEIKYASGLIGSILICCIFYWSSITNLKKVIQDKKQMLKQWSFSIKFEGPLILHSLSYLVLNQSDRVMIGRMVGNAQAAYYSIAYNLATVIILFQNSINQALLPWRYEMLQKKYYKKIRESTNYLLGVLSIGILLFILICPEIMKILFTANYYEAIWCIPPISLSVFFMFLYTVFVNIETYFEETRYVMYVSVTCALLNIVLNFLGIHYWGYISCAYATLISYILFSVGHYYFSKQILKRNNIQIDDIIDIKMTLLISIGALAITLIFTCLYEYWILRWLIVGVIFILGIINRNTLIKVIKTIKGKK